MLDHTGWPVNSLGIEKRLDCEVASSIPLLLHVFMWEEVKTPRKQQYNPGTLNNKPNTSRTGRKSLFYTKPEGRLRKIHSPNYKECKAITEI